MSSISAFLNDKRVRDILYQVGALGGIVGLLIYFIRNASENMVKAGIASGFDFLGRTSGIDVPFVLNGYQPSGTIMSLFWTGVVNTIFVSFIAMVLATLLGFAIGIARLSKIWLLSALAGGYIEFVRNIPLLFFVLFWYFGVLATLPGPRDSIGFFGVAFLNNRGLTVPTPEQGAIFKWVLIGALVAWLLQWGVARWGRARKAATGQDAPVFLIGLVLCGSLPVLLFTLLDRLGCAGTARLQLSRRLCHHSRIRGTAGSARHLHGGLCGRDRARRHHGRAQGPAGGVFGSGLARHADLAAGGGASGHARHGAAHDQPVSQRAEKLVLWRRHCLS
jgi:His/Glu/Gln/Arg/opine family amino acid ABC transporter permease subunit